jgi:hypothetical protein
MLTLHVTCTIDLNQHSNKQILSLLLIPCQVLIPLNYFFKQRRNFYDKFKPPLYCWEESCQRQRKFLLGAAKSLQPVPLFLKSTVSLIISPSQLQTIFYFNIIKCLFRCPGLFQLFIKNVPTSHHRYPSVK